MNMNQVAVAYTNEQERDRIKQMLGLAHANWVKDTVKADVKVMNKSGEYSYGENVAELEFCMDMGGTQFELIRYTSGPNWINGAVRIGVPLPMVAHVGFHLDEGEEFPTMADAPLVQEAITLEHSNREVNEAGRRYHYRIHRVGPACYFKFIKRLTVKDQALTERDLKAGKEQALPPVQPTFSQTERQAPATEPATGLAGASKAVGTGAGTDGDANSASADSVVGKTAAIAAATDAKAAADADPKPDPAATKAGVAPSSDLGSASPNPPAPTIPPEVVTKTAAPTTPATKTAAERNADNKSKKSQ